MHPGRVFIGMSGGVDSSVAAYLLEKDGYDVTGVFLRSYNVDGCAEQDAEDARRAAEHIGIPFYVWDVEREYKEKVVKYMVDGYKAGETPNPDVMCNHEIKFGIFLKRAMEMGADYAATGHYVRLRRSDANPRINAHAANSEPSIYSIGRKENFASFAHGSRYLHRLLIAKDNNKDQSYFLWTLTQEQLSHCLFPIGDYTKPEVRAIARAAGLLTAEKKDSQGICFLGQVTLADFLKTYLPERVGAVVNTDGKKIGEHKGAHFFTAGQRHAGFTYRITGAHGTSLKPHYVVRKDVRRNTVTVAEGPDHQALYKKEITLRDVNFLSGAPLAMSNGPLFARVRYRQPLAKAMLVPSDKRHATRETKAAPLGGFNRLTAGKLGVIFDQPQKFVAPGQSAVFYSDKGEMLGGGVITAVH